MNQSATVLAQLRAWFRAQCDGDWEHSYGVTIETLDNPGWLVTIDLADTKWEHLSRPCESVQRDETDWIQSEFTDGKFIGCGGVDNLEEVIELFLETVK